MNIAFREHSEFSKMREALFGNDEGYRTFQNVLMQQPQIGAVIPGAGAARKVRWNDPLRGKGKRGGIRIIYSYVEEARYIFLLFAYDKNTNDLTPDQKRAFRIVAEEFRKEITT